MLIAFRDRAKLKGEGDRTEMADHMTGYFGGSLFVTNATGRGRNIYHDVHRSAADMPATTILGSSERDVGELMSGRNQWGRVGWVVG